MRSHLRGLGYELSDEERNVVFTKFKALADKQKHVMEEDLEAVVTQGVLPEAETIKLEYLHVHSGTTFSPMAGVKDTINKHGVQGARRDSSMRFY